MSNPPGVPPDVTRPGTRGRSWLARLSFALAVVAVALVLAVAGWKSVAMFAVGLAAAVVSLTAAFFVLSRRGVLRWLALAVFVAAPVAVVVVYAFASLLWVALVSAAAWLLAGLTARAALAGSSADWRMPELPATPARRPFLIMNPRSGGGKVVHLGLQPKAEALGAQVFLMDGPELVDVAAVARQAVADGADLLGVAGGDGTQALVAGVAAEHGLPFLVIAAGTRNHFALDLGLDRADPVAGLSALSDGVELLVDLGQINGHTFVNNVSFGAYAEVVQTPAYRDDKIGTTLDTLPDLLQGQRGTPVSAVADGVTIDGPQALLVASNPYETGDIAGLGRRARLDSGVLGVVAVTVGSARQAVGLLRGRHSTGLRVLTAQSVVVTSTAEQIPVGVDGEAVLLPVPVRCEIRPGALRVRVPRSRPGVPAPKPAISLSRLGQLASWQRRPRPGSGPGEVPFPVPGDQGSSAQVPDARRLRAAHRPAQRAGARPGPVPADHHLRRGAPGRVVGQRPAETGRGRSGARGRARAAAGPAGRGLRHQLQPPARAAPGHPGGAGDLPGFRRQARADGAVPRAAQTGCGGR
jgi:diacylglycerol kinase family enzyme